MHKKKLNLGAGFDHRPGWINADIDPLTKPDQIVDLSAPLPFPDDSIDEVLLQDVLEHFIKQDAQRLLLEIARVLKPNASVTVRVPNPVQIMHQFADDPEVMMEFLYGTTSQNGIWGAHKYGYQESIIQKMFTLAGFTDIQIQPETTNFQISAKKSAHKIPQPNILIIQQSPDWGGAEEWMTTLISNWRNQDILVTGVTNYQQMLDRWQESGAKTIRLPFILDIMGNIRGLIKSIVLFPYAIWWYFKLLNDQKAKGINVVIMSGFTEKMVCSWIASILKVSVVWFEYGPLGPVFKRNFYFPKLIYRLTKHIPEYVLTISESTKRSLIADGRISLSKIAVIPPGIVIPKSFTANTKKPHPVIGHLSRLAPEKGQRLILEAFKVVLQQYPKAILKIAGRGPDRDYLEQQADLLQIEKNIEFLGFVNDKNKFYRSIDVFVFAGIWNMEGFGMVMTEALSHGIPVVAVNNGPTKEIINQDVGIVTHATPESIAEGIIQIIKENPQARSNQAYKYAKANYNATIQVAKITQYVQQAVVLNQ